jgi:hypothetical protein
MEQLGLDAGSNGIAPISLALIRPSLPSAKQFLQ